MKEWQGPRAPQVCWSRHVHTRSLLLKIPKVKTRNSFLKDYSFEVLIKMQITKKNTGTPMFTGYGKRIFKKVNICITDSLGYTPEANTL